MKRANNPTRKQNRQTEAADRQAARDARTPREQYDRLEAAGHGNCREAERLALGNAWTLGNERL